MPKTKAIKKQEKTTVPQQIEKLRRVLGGLGTDIEEKKGALIALAHLGVKEANEVIADFIFNLNDILVKDLRSWAEIALDEGEFMASVPKNAAEEERMLKESVYQDYLERFAELSGKIEDAEEDIGQRKYEYEVVKRLKKKAKTPDEKEHWDLEEMAHHDILVWEENRKARWEEELETVSSILAEIEAELEDIVN